MENNIDFEYLRGLPFKQRVSYSKSVLGEKIGEGSSRVVFKYGTDKVLKVSKNRLGLAQNYGEVNQYRKLSNPSSLLSKIYEYDDNDWSYIVCEHVKVLTKKEFIKKIGCRNRFEFIKLIKKFLKHGVLPKNKIVADFCTKIKNSGVEIRYDFMKISSIGIRDTTTGDEIVIIDCGVNDWMANHMDFLYSGRKWPSIVGKTMGICIAIIVIILFPLAYPLTKLYKRIFRKNVIK